MQHVEQRGSEKEFCLLHCYWIHTSTAWGISRLEIKLKFIVEMVYWKNFMALAENGLNDPSFWIITIFYLIA